MLKLKNGWEKIKSGVSRVLYVEPEEPLVLTERQKAIIAKLAEWIVSRQLTVPSVMFLESITPLNYLGSQALVFFYPFVTAFLNSVDYKAFQEFLEHRESISILIDAIETRDKKRRNPDPGEQSRSEVYEQKTR